MSKASASTPLAAESSAYRRTASATGGSTATIHATRPWRRSPPLNARSSDAAQAASAPETLLRSPSGRHCSISSAAMIAPTLIPACSCEHSIEIHQHARGRAPDHAVLVLEYVVAHGLPLELARAALAVALVQQESERNLEDLRHLMRIGRQRERRGEQADHRRHHIAGPGAVIRQPRQHFNAFRPQPDLLFNLAQGGELGARVAWLGTAAGEGDLAGMAAQVRGALRKEHAQRLGMGDDRDEHRGWGAGRRAAFGAVVAVYSKRGRGSLEPRPQLINVHLGERTT